MAKSNHGAYCGLGTIMMSYLQNRGEKIVRNHLITVGAPTCAAEVDVKPGEIVKALTMALLKAQLRLGQIEYTLSQ